MKYVSLLLSSLTLYVRPGWIGCGALLACDSGVSMTIGAGCLPIFRTDDIETPVGQRRQNQHDGDSDPSPGRRLPLRLWKPIISVFGRRVAADSASINRSASW